MKSKLLSSLVIPFAALAGCVDDPTMSDELDPDELGETAQQLTSTALNSFTCSTKPFCSINLGTINNRACFIAGIRGAAGGIGSDTFGSFSGIFAEGPDYVLTIYPQSTSTPITVTTVCVKPAANVVTQRWNTNFGVSSVVIPGTTASSRCFLNLVGGSNGGLKHYDDSIRTWKEPNGTWRIGGSTVAGAYLTASATCFDVASNKGDWGWGQGLSGSITGNLASNTTGGVACGLTEIGGIVTTNNATNDGVFIDYLSGSQQWIWTLKNYKHGAANCIK